ncbi:hypothetical protein NPIL_127921 [Nephila pilipes]|uniref:Uncharacterized protein n=1 Tax=Nephila pilipes TaxID=299642 RepID=A0A8X6QPJ8_NEPPI|nr:hypothetical protein NPIL_127921 [Nephila pilipes]
MIPNEGIATARIICSSMKRVPATSWLNVAPCRKLEKCVPEKLNSQQKEELPQQIPICKKKAKLNNSVWFNEQPGTTILIPKNNIATKHISINGAESPVTEMLAYKTL